MIYVADIVYRGDCVQFDIDLPGNAGASHCCTLEWSESARSDFTTQRTIHHRVRCPH